MTNKQDLKFKWWAGFCFGSIFGLLVGMTVIMTVVVYTY